MLIPGETSSLSLQTAMFSMSSRGLPLRVLTPGVAPFSHEDTSLIGLGFHLYDPL